MVICAFETLKAAIKTLLCMVPVVLFFSCSKASDSPKGCVSAFIMAVEQHDMTKAWSLLSSDAQKYYNELGEKQRRSGKGALEHEINRIKSFFNAEKGYSIRKDKDNPDIIRLVVLGGGKDFIVETINEDGYKIKDGNSVKNILNIIAEKVEKEENY